LLVSCLLAAILGANSSPRMIATNEPMEHLVSICCTHEDAAPYEGLRKSYEYGWPAAFRAEVIHTNIHPLLPGESPGDAACLQGVFYHSNPEGREARAWCYTPYSERWFEPFILSYDCAIILGILIISTIALEWSARRSELITMARRQEVSGQSYRLKVRPAAVLRRLIPATVRSGSGRP